MAANKRDMLFCQFVRQMFLDLYCSREVVCTSVATALCWFCDDDARLSDSQARRSLLVTHPSHVVNRAARCWRQARQCGQQFGPTFLPNIPTITYCFAGLQCSSLHVNVL